VSEPGVESLLEEISELYAIMLRIARGVHDGDDAMTATQRLALIEIANAGPLRLKTLARRMNTTPATVTRAIDALEELTFVERRADPEDKRGVIVATTRRGRSWADRRRREIRKVIEVVPETARRERLVRDLRRLNAALRDASGTDELSRGALLARGDLA
jgi:DNA-binding MarR family transcriptional regulator